MAVEPESVNVGIVKRPFFRIDVARVSDSPYFLNFKSASGKFRVSRRSFGVIAQLVERLNGIEEVWGSNPHGSTKGWLNSISVV